MNTDGWMVFFQKETKDEALKASERLRMSSDYQVRIRQVKVRGKARFEVLANQKPIIIRTRKEKNEEPMEKELEV